LPPFIFKPSLCNDKYSSKSWIILVAVHPPKLYTLESRFLGAKRQLRPPPTSPKHESPDKNAWKNRLGLGWVYLLSTNRARWDNK
jgi:hypothetical protein